MTQLPGTSNLDSLNVAAGLTVGGTTTFNGPVNNSVGGLMPGTLYGAAGTVTLTSGIVAFNAAVAGFAVQLPAPKLGARFDIVNQVAASSGSNTITIPSGGTIYQGTISGSVLTFATVGQTAVLIGLSATQYRSMTPGTTSPTLS